MSRLDEVLGTAILKGKKALGKEAPEVLRLPLDLLRVRGQPRRRFEKLPIGSTYAFDIADHRGSRIFEVG